MLANTDGLTTVGSFCADSPVFEPDGALAAGASPRGESPEVCRSTSAIPDGSAETAVVSSSVSVDRGGAFSASTRERRNGSFTGKLAVQRKCNANSDTDGNRAFWSLARARDST